MEVVESEEGLPDRGSRTAAAGQTATAAEAVPQLSLPVRAVCLAGE